MKWVFLAKAEKNGRVISAGYELPKSFVVCADAVYLSQLASTTLQKRWEEAVKGINRNQANQGYR